MSTIGPRIAYYKLAPDGIKHLQALERYLADCGTPSGSTSCGIAPIVLGLVLEEAATVLAIAF